MNPVSLFFSLATPAGSVEPGDIHGLFPDLEWGVESDLLRHSDEWPSAVVLVTNRERDEPEEQLDFPVDVEFLHYPGRVAGNDLAMLATKLALLRLLSCVYECRVVCDADGFAEEDSITNCCAGEETFLCQGGRVYGGYAIPFEARDGGRPADGWTPLDDLTETTLRPDGTLHDEVKSLARLLDWIATRDLSHLRDPLFPDLPDLVEGDHFPPRTEEEISETIAEPLEEEGPEQTEEDWLTYVARMDALEVEGITTSSKRLIREGITLPPPDSLVDEELRAKLWEVIHGLARAHTYLERTDHLSDRELYQWLWEEGLNESVADLIDLDEYGGYHTSPIGSGDEESSRISMIYYDSAAERAEWKAANPDLVIPAHQPPPFERDHLLPKSNEWLF